MNDATSNPARKLVFETGPCTLFMSGMFGWRKRELRSAKIFVGPFAQYARAYHVHFVQKGKRKEEGFVIYDDPRGLLVSGHNLPDVADPMVDTGDGNRITKYSSFDPRWNEEFAKWAAVHIPADRILFDLAKHTKAAE